MKITFDMDVAVLSDRYRDNVKNLMTIAQNLRYADTKYSTATTEDQNKWRDRCVAKMKAIEAFYLTEDVLPEYTLADWVKDSFGLRNMVGAVLNGNDPLSCTLTDMGFDWVDGKKSMKRDYNRMLHAFARIPGKTGWRLSFRDFGERGSRWMELRLEKPKEV